MRRIVKGLTVALAGAGAAVAMAAGGGGQPTTLGDAAIHVTSAVYGDEFQVQAADQTGVPSYAVPAGGGVITRWSIQLIQATAPGDVTLKVVQPLGADEYRIVGDSVGHVATDDGFRTFAARIPVTGGERLALHTPAGGNVQVGSTGFNADDTGDIRAKAGDGAVGETVTVASFANHSHIAMSAVVEPDADKDGFGDISQDTCPQDAGRHDGPCVSDLSITIAGTPASIAQGDTAVVSGVVGAALGTASGATATAVLPAGLQLVTGVASGGACTGTLTVACPLGDVVPGSPANVVLAVRGTQAGAQPVAASVASATADPNAANDSSSATLTVNGVVARLPECVVPPLKGLKRAGAAKLLKAFKCKLGKVTTKRKPRRGKLRVSASKPKAATRAPAGTKVAITLRRVR